MAVTSEDRLMRDIQRAEASRLELAERIARSVRGDGRAEPLEGVQLRRESAPTELGHGSSFPALCAVAQGGKETRLGESVYHYDPANFLVTTAALPISSRITDATAEAPYLGVVVRLDPALVGSVMVETALPSRRPHGTVAAFGVSELDTGLLDAIVRLMRLLDAPRDARFLAPLIKREIVYRLLLGEQGDRVRQIATLGGESNRMAEAIARIRRDFDRPLRIEDLARDLGMSVSGFHHHFKAVTAMTPLQFQKQLRLQEARRLMLGEDFDAASAGYRVGYEDASHFNREYKRLFGAPPVRDVARLRFAPAESAGL